MVGWYHPLNGHESEQSPGDSEGRKAWHAAVLGVAESDMTQQLNNNRSKQVYTESVFLGKLLSLSDSQGSQYRVGSHPCLIVFLVEWAWSKVHESPRHRKHLRLFSYLASLMVSMMESHAGTWPSGGNGGTAWFTVSSQVTPIRCWAPLQRPTANDRLSSCPVLGDCFHRSKLVFEQQRYGVQ